MNADVVLIEEGPVARKVLDHLGLPATGPAIAPARLGQADFWPTGPPSPPDCDPPWTDDLQPSPADSRA